MESPFPATQSPPSSGSFQTVPTPSSSASRRRSSVSSVTSSGRRRKDQSLVDVASSLGRRTPDHSLRSDEAFVTRSRQLDFGSDGVEHTQDESDEYVVVDAAGHSNDYAEEEQDGGNAVENGGDEQEQDSNNAVENDQDEGGEVDQKEAADGGRTASSEGAADGAALTGHNDTESEEEIARALKRGRRKKVFWTSEEVDCLRAGVEKYGVGNWRTILENGRDVFLAHRTNVDLKDKWKNIHLDRPKRQRRHKPQADTDVLERGIPSDTNARGQPRRRAAIEADYSMVVIATAEDSSADQDSLADTDNQLSGLVKLKLATDECFPQLIDFSVNLDTCQKVSVLKERILSSILPSASREAAIQLVGLTSRCLLGDEEQILQCISNNGPDFFVVLEDSPEEFV